MIYNFDEVEHALLQVTEWLTLEYKSLSTGRATPSVLDTISVESYGSYSAIAHIASISLEDSRTLRVVPWDKTQLKSIEKAIQEADLGLSVSSDDAGVRVFFPQLTTETRAKLVKVLKEKLEEARVRARGIREKAMKDIDAAEKEGGMSADEKNKLKEEVQASITAINMTLEALFEKKEKDTMTL